MKFNYTNFGENIKDKCWMCVLDILSMRAIQIGVAFFFMVVAGSLLYSWYVYHTTESEFAETYQIQQHPENQNAARLTAADGEMYITEMLGTPTTIQAYEEDIYRGIFPPHLTIYEYPDGGIDPYEFLQAHNNSSREVITHVRNWLRTASRRASIPGGSIIWRRYQEFREKLPQTAQECQLTVEELIFNDYTLLVAQWLENEGN